MRNISREKKIQDDAESAKRNERKRKRSSLKSAEADLKVIVGEETGESEVYWHISQILASQSSYVDTLLSTQLPTYDNSNPSRYHKEIIFPDVTPSQWENMIGFLSNPLTMRVKDAMELALPYDKYVFEMGIKICDDILSNKALPRIPSLSALSKSVCDPLKVDQSVQAIELSQSIVLRKTSHWGRVWLHCLFANLNIVGPETGFQLSESQIIQLVPTIVRDGKLRYFEDVLDRHLDEKHENHHIAEIISRDADGQFTEYLNGHGEELGLRLEVEINKLRSYNISNDMFPDLFTALNEKSSL